MFAVVGRHRIGPLFPAIGADALLLVDGVRLWARLFSVGPEVRTRVARDPSLVSSRLAVVAYGLVGAVLLQGLRGSRSALTMVVSRVALLFVSGVWIGGLVPEAADTLAGLGIAQSIGGGLGAPWIRRELDRSGATAIH